MLKACQLFANGGNYSEDEIEWYRGQMKEIDTLFEEMSAKRKEHTEQLIETMHKLQKDPTAEFTTAYTDSIHQLSAKDGLGKTYG